MCARSMRAIGPTPTAPLAERIVEGGWGAGEPVALQSATGRDARSWRPTNHCAKHTLSDKRGEGGGREGALLPSRPLGAISLATQYMTISCQEYWRRLYCSEK